MILHSPQSVCYLRSIAVVAFCIFIASCASVPLGTLLRFSAFDEQDFAEIDPETLSVRIFLQDPAKLSDTPVSLSLLLETAGEPIIGDYEMQPSLTFRDTVSAGIFSPDVQGTMHQFELTADQVTVFRQLQNELSNLEITHMTFTTSFHLDRSISYADQVKVWVFLAMDEKADYITLIEGASLDVEQRYTDDSGSTTE